MQINKKENFPKLLLISQWVFYLSSLLFAISRILTTIFNCWSFKYQPITYNGLSITYIIHWFSFLLISYGRLRSVFQDTVYEINKKTIYCLSFMFIFMFCFSIFVGILVSLGMEIGFVFGGLVLIMVLITAQYLTWSFVHKLRKLRNVSSSDINNIDKTNQLSNTVKKYSVLSVISVTFSTLYVIILIILAVSGINFNVHWIIEVLALILCLDVFIDSLCMSLTLKVNDKYYKYLCYICDHDGSDANYNQSQLAKVVSQSQLTPSTMKSSTATMPEII